MKRTKHIFVLALCVIVSLPILLNTAAISADELNQDADKNIVLGTSHIKGGQVNNIYYGHYTQSSLGTVQPEGIENVDWIKNDNATQYGYGPYYSIDPIKWRVLSISDSRTMLFSDKILDDRNFNEAYGGIIWGESTMRSWLNGYDSSYNACKISYTTDNFIDSAFTSDEKIFISDTLVKNDYYSYWGTSNEYDTTDKIFLLSVPEAENSNYGFDTSSMYIPSSSREARETEYGIGYGINNNWWLRNPGTRYISDHIFVMSSGWISFGGTMPNASLGVRPAFNLDISSVLFASAAENGKPDGFNKVADYSGIDWKLTLKDDAHKNFTAKVSAILGNDVVISYQNAVFGENEYISVIIKNNDIVKYYGRLALAEQNGTVTLTVPVDFDANNGDTLCIINEQYNGEYETDYSSDLIELSLTDSHSGIYASIDGYAVDNYAAVITPAISGTYIVMFADYENECLNKTDLVEYTFVEGKTTTVEQKDKTFKLGKGDKILLWNDTAKLIPLCSAYVIE